MHLTKQSCISGLTSSQLKMSTASVVTVYTQTTEVPPSGVVITISQSGSTTQSFHTPTTSEKQRKVYFNATFNCAAGDILTVAVTSSASPDQPPNLIKTLIDMKQGI